MILFILGIFFSVINVKCVCVSKMVFRHSKTFVHLSVFRSYVETLSTAAFDSIIEFEATLALSRSPFVTNNSHYDHDDDQLTVWPGRHGGPSLGAFLSHG